MMYMVRKLSTLVSGRGQEGNEGAEWAARQSEVRPPGLSHHIKRYDVTSAWHIPNLLPALGVPHELAVQRMLLLSFTVGCDGL